MASQKPRSRKHHQQPATVPVALAPTHHDAGLYDQQLRYVDPTADQPFSIADVNTTLNLRVLQRYVPDLYTIVHTAPYVVLYTFNLETSTWEKAETEGTLFVCALQSEHVAEGLAVDRFSVVILNRRGLKNFIVELKTVDDVDVSEEYVILKAGDEGEEKAYGLWIYAEEGKSTETSRVDTARFIIECAQRAQETREAAQQLQSHAPYDANVHATNEGEGGVGMTRQLSLRELFGQHRDHDAGFDPMKHMPDGLQNQQMHQYQQQQLHQQHYPQQAFHQPTPSQYHSQNPLQQPQQPLFHSSNHQTLDSIISPDPVHGYATTSAVHETAQQYANNNQLPPSQQLTPHASMLQFANHPDTDFFRAGPRSMPQQQQPQVPPQQVSGAMGTNGGGSIALDDLFRSARGFQHGGPHL